MSSIKRLKSKGRATTGTPKGQSPGAYVDGVLEACDEGDPVAAISYYDYRKGAFAGQPPATTVRPMRIVKARFHAAVSNYQRRLHAAAAVGMDWKQASAVTEPEAAAVKHEAGILKQARAFAKHGYGKGVHLAAA